MFWVLSLASHGSEVGTLSGKSPSVMNIDKMNASEVKFNEEKTECQKFQRSHWSIGWTHDFKLGRLDYKKKEKFKPINEIIFFIYQ